MENKVQFNLKNVHYALHTEEGFGTPVHIPGAVSLALDPNGSVTPFYADGMIYYNGIANNGYSGDLVMARFPDQMLKDVWGFIEGETSKVLVEDASIEPKTFALLYQIDGDADNQYYVMYNCSAQRPGVGSQTNGESKEPQTQTSNITAAPLSNGRVMARTTSTTPENVKSGWFNTVFVEE